MADATGHRSPTAGMAAGIPDESERGGAQRTRSPSQEFDFPLPDP
jgi:hypothetical protein